MRCFETILANVLFSIAKEINNMTLANNAATSSAQGEMDLSSLLRLCIADLPCLFFCKDQIQPRVFHYKQHLRRTPQDIPLTSQLFLLSRRGVAAVARDSSTAAKCLLLRSCRRRMLLETGRAKSCPRGSSIIPATRPATFLSSLGRCFRHGSTRQAQERTLIEPEWLRYKLN